MKIDLIFQKKYLKKLIKYFGGESEIRTHERVAPLPVFKTGAFNRSAISPNSKIYYTLDKLMSKYNIIIILTKWHLFCYF
tara:strand:- start:1013 stop:1252 length:240 start_codon:yes stop_codon:yes gene_type:complete